MIMQIRRFHFFPKKSLNLKRQWSNLGSQDNLLGVMHSYWLIYIATITQKSFARKNQTKKHLHQYPDMVGIVRASTSNLTSFFTLFCREFDADQLKPHLHLWYNNIGCCIVFRIWECLSEAKTFDEAETKHWFLSQMKWHEWPLFFITVLELLADKFYGNDWYVSCINKSTE